jgi:hypothetical protein
MNLQERIYAFSELGEILRDSLAGIETKYSPALNGLIDTQQLNNPWFTPPNVRAAMNAIAHELTHENLVKWCGMYDLPEKEPNPSAVGVIMAGNIPMVGFHDMLSVLITGNNLIARTSTKDPDLLPFIASILCDLNHNFGEKIRFTGTLSGFDKIIATGSDNSSRYFEYYFGKYPGIIRKNRNSIGIIDGSETEDELKALGNDVFSFFGLGCRNVSKLYVPAGYDFSRMISCWEDYSELIRHSKYANNYDFSKAVYLVNREQFLDSGFVLLKENSSLSSPVAVIYYEYYASRRDINGLGNLLKDKIQLICGKKQTPFGMAQSPFLWDYADGTDTIAFLLKKNSPVIL